MPLGKRKTGVEDAPSQVEKIDGFSHEMRVECGIHDYAGSKSVYDRFLSMVDPDIIVEPVFRLALDKRKTGSEDAPCVMEILQELLCDMQVVIEKTDDVSSVRIYNRFLAERKTGVVSRFFKAHAPDTPETRQTEDEVWTGPHPHPPSCM